jgi:hypothetical protein
MTGRVEDGLTEDEAAHVDWCKRVTGMLPPVGVHTMEELTGEDQRRLLAIISRLASDSAVMERAAAYALVEKELRERGVCSAWFIDDPSSLVSLETEEQDTVGSTLFEAVSKLRDSGRGDK